MIKRVVFVFAILAFIAANAETYKVTLFQPAVVQGTELKAGQYKLDLENSKLTITSGKQSVETTVKVETAEKKFSSTTVRYANTEGKYSIQEIRLGGTKTKLILNP
jgi:hypothetical protein